MVKQSEASKGEGPRVLGGASAPCMQGYVELGLEMDTKPGEQWSRSKSSFLSPPPPQNSFFDGSLSREHVRGANAAYEHVSQRRSQSAKLVSQEFMNCITAFIIQRAPRDDAIDQ